MNKSVEMLIAGALLAASAATAVQAQQRDPAYQSARTQGLIGEKTNGYLGFVTAPSPAIKALVDDLNIKRKEQYTKSSIAESVTVENFAFRTACRLISERTAVGEHYQLPNGSWTVKTAAPATLRPECPAA